MSTHPADSTNRCSNCKQWFNSLYFPFIASYCGFCWNEAGRADFTATWWAQSFHIWRDTSQTYQRSMFMNTAQFLVYLLAHSPIFDAATLVKGLNNAAGFPIHPLYPRYKWKMMMQIERTLQAKFDNEWEFGGKNRDKLMRDLNYLKRCNEHRKRRLKTC